MTGFRNRHADERERRRRKARYGMQVTGHSVHLLSRLAAGTMAKKRKKKQPRKKRKKRNKR